MKLLYVFCATLAASAAWLAHGADTATIGAPSTLDQLLAGNRRFVEGKATHLHESIERRGEVAKGQHPTAVIVGCADSRVPPELVFDQGLGDLFVVRCAGNVLGDASLGSIEYAVEHLGVELVVVLGHERCGAVDAVVKGGELPGHLSAFTPAIAPVVESAKKKGGDVLDNAVRANAQRITRQLEECEPILSEYKHLGKLRVVAARYDLDTGEVEVLDTKPTGASRSSGAVGSLHAPSAEPAAAERQH